MGLLEVVQNVGGRRLGVFGFYLLVPLLGRRDYTSL